MKISRVKNYEQEIYSGFFETEGLKDSRISKFAVFIEENILSVSYLYSMLHKRLNFSMFL